MRMVYSDSCEYYGAIVVVIVIIQVNGYTV